jgi:hypothetical protein
MPREAITGTSGHATGKTQDDRHSNSLSPKKIADTDACSYCFGQQDGADDLGADHQEFQDYRVPAQVAAA